MSENPNRATLSLVYFKLNKNDYQNLIEEMLRRFSPSSFDVFLGHFSTLAPVSDPRLAEANYELCEIFSLILLFVCRTQIVVNACCC